MTQTLLSQEWVCVFCNAEYDSCPYVCCNEYKGLMTCEDAIAAYPDLYAWEV